MHFGEVRNEGNKSPMSARFELINRIGAVAIMKRSIDRVKKTLVSFTWQFSKKILKQSAGFAST